jgi:hypothetical protein
MSVKPDLLLMTPATFERVISKIHKRYRPAMGFTNKRASRDKNAQRRGDWPVHKLDCKVLMSRVEFRSRNYITGAAQRQNI